MKTKLSLAVASALVAAASSANAGITIPAGDWTLDIGGVVNAYYTHTNVDKVQHTLGYGGLFYTQANTLGKGAGKNDVSNITTGLLPNYLSVSGKTRQNDLDVGFTISINPGASTIGAGYQGPQQENRQAFLTFGDASWGSIKLGKDLGIFASDAILNDMTLLGVGSGAGGLAGNTTTTGRIGTGFMYADWKSQIAYTSPNWSGFNFTAGVTQAWNAIAVSNKITATAGGSTLPTATSTQRGGSNPAFEAKASYAWEGDFAGKVWVSGLHQKVEFATTSEDATAYDIGATVNVAGFGLTGYYYDGEGIGQTVQLNLGFDGTGKARDSKGGYIQATYTIPGVGTKIGASWGESILEGTSADRAAVGFDELKDEMWTIGVYHPLTKHLNLVAEYSNVKSEVSRTIATLDQENEADTFSVGAILFF
ncbi:MAG TPA: porin [Methylophilaceae bacterium]|nr:porin [Methylophilaceae bacterium]